MMFSRLLLAVALAAVVLGGTAVGAFAAHCAITSGCTTPPRVPISR